MKIQKNKTKQRGGKGARSPLLSVCLDKVFWALKSAPCWGLSCRLPSVFFEVTPIPSPTPTPTPPLCTVAAGAES